MALNTNVKLLCCYSFLIKISKINRESSVNAVCYVILASLAELRGATEIKVSILARLEIFTSAYAPLK